MIVTKEQGFACMAAYELIADSGLATDELMKWDSATDAMRSIGWMSFHSGDADVFFDLDVENNELAAEQVLLALAFCGTIAGDAQ